MNIKYYLRGLGVGLVVATVILAIAYRINDSKNNIIEQARKLGMVFPSEITEASSEDDTSLDTTLEESTNDTSLEDTTEDASLEDTTEEDTTEEDTTTTEEETSTEEATTTIVAVVTGQITITSSMGSESVSQALKNAGIISDWSDFNNYLINNGYAQRIQNGTFTVNSGMSYKEIAELIS